MEYRSYDGTFEYEGKEYPWSVSRYWFNSDPKGLQSKSIFSLMVNHYFVGFIQRDETGYWFNMDDKPLKNIPFEMQSSDYSAIGEIIEREMPDLI